MARSRTIAAFAVLAPLALLAACNLLTGLGDYEKVDCVRDCVDAAAESGSFAADASDGALDAPDGARPIDAGISPASLRERWAAWPMPSPASDAEVVTHPASYTDNGSTVTDAVTGLAWTKDAPTGMSLEQAVSYCAGVSFPGSWRVPSRIELASLIDTTQTTPALDPTYFPDAASGPYWTRSPVIDPNGADAGAWWTVDFDQGKVSAGGPDQRAVRCVSGGAQ